MKSKIKKYPVLLVWYDDELQSSIVPSPSGYNSSFES